MTQIRRRFTGAHTLQVESRPEPGQPWRPLSHLVAFGYESPYTPGWELRHAIGYGGRPGSPVLPFQPLSVRHFCSSEQAVLEAFYAHMKRILPPVASAWEGFLAGARERVPGIGGPRTGPIETAYRLNNPLAVVPSHTPLHVPAGARGLDFQPRLGFVIHRELSDATPEEARAAIAAFVLTCEFHAANGVEGRDTVPVPASPPSSLAEIIIPAPDLIDDWPSLMAAASVNGEVIGQASAADASMDLGELLAAASTEGRLLPGELFSVDALAPAGGTRALSPGDHLVVAAPRLGRIEHRIS
ncbi:MAG TPA: fumarylacetoacetate hydrolase family protein [Solirubrobacteraceae bacterium]|nr:fumarylacetoacetate hydrolase family protein [Solirubrobacteraceae bacterium]